MISVRLSLPPRECNPNWRGHWQQRRKAAKAYRQESFAAFYPFRRLLIDGPMERAECSVEFYFATRRRRDPDNAMASLKPVWDGMQDARLIKNDSGLVLLPPKMRISREDPRVEIVVGELATPRHGEVR